jgi:hypothetical protein
MIAKGGKFTAIAAGDSHFCIVNKTGRPLPVCRPHAVDYNDNRATVETRNGTGRGHDPGDGLPDRLRSVGSE